MVHVILFEYWKYLDTRSVSKIFELHSPNISITKVFEYRQRNFTRNPSPIFELQFFHQTQVTQSSL